MSQHPLYVNILWHMHQPYYKDVNNQQYLMPWVRLHATKDYLDMPLIAAEFPGVKVTFNMVPSLLEQIQEYAAGTARDPYLNLALKPAEALDEIERVHVLRLFFACHYEHMIKPYARYQQLHDRRGWSDAIADLRQRAPLFTPADLRDIITWYFITWIDPFLRVQYPRLAILERKGRMFTEDEKLEVLEIGRDITSRIVPSMKELWDQGKIEISTTPFFHPILPLLIDTEIARRPRPRVSLPIQRFRHPEDAQLQIEKGLDYCRELFGRRPAGMWPSEGSICPEVVPMFEKSGVGWIASDEDGLALTLGIGHFGRDSAGVPDSADALYRPYIATHEGAQTAIFYRDHFLSDQIGFKYAHWNPGDAAADLLRRLEEIQHKLRDSAEPHIVSIILDGENCWEHYEDDGLPFLRALYKGLSEHRSLETITPSEFLKQFPQQRRLDRLHSGSWINHDFGIWIGHPEDNASWDLLTQARQEIGARLATQGASDVASKEKAIKSLMIAEGSDWNWWYGDENSSAFDEEFDALYRQHLANAYSAVGLEPPARLFIPISASKEHGMHTPPSAFIEPKLDGRVTNYFEWYSAGHYDPRRGGDSMHQTDAAAIESLYFGFGRGHFYLRVDLSQAMRERQGATGKLIVYIFTHENYQVQVPLDGVGGTAKVTWEKPVEGWTECEPLTEFAVGSIIEIAFSLEKFQIVPDTMLRIQTAIEIEGREVERCPGRAPLPISAPTKDFEEIMWIV